MQYTTLGKTGLKISEIGLGTWAFNSSVYGPVVAEDAERTIQKAREAGINYFDTAPLYGDKDQDGIAEEVLGKALQGWRDEVIVSTKFGRKPTEGNKANFYGAYAVQSGEESLRRLRTDYIDLLFFHSPFAAEEIHDDVWAALDGLQAAGKVRFIGHSISKFADTQEMARTWAFQRKIDAIQVVYSLLNREAQVLIRDLSAEGIGVVARESLANGFLSGAIGRDTVFQSGTLNARYEREEIVARVEQVERLSFLVRAEVQSMAQAALRWVLDEPGVSSVLTGAKNEMEVADCAGACNASGYGEEELLRADELHQRDFAAA